MFAGGGGGLVGCGGGGGGSGGSGGHAGAGGVKGTGGGGGHAGTGGSGGGAGNVASTGGAGGAAGSGGNGGNGGSAGGGAGQGGANNGGAGGGAGSGGNGGNIGSGGGAGAAGSGGTGGQAGGAGNGGAGGNGGARDAGVDMGWDADLNQPCLPGGDAGVKSDGGQALVADQHQGFSFTQNLCAWSYGYEQPAADAGADASSDQPFQLMAQFNHANQYWAVAEGTYWTIIGQDFAHPNGVTTSTGRTPVNQWAVRRWTSTVAGSITITGAIRKASNGSGGNGVDARVVVDGVVVYAQYIAGTDQVGVSYSVTATVAVGSHVDLVLDPHLGYDGSDTTIFTAQVWH